MLSIKINATINCILLYKLSWLPDSYSFYLHHCYTVYGVDLTTLVKLEGGIVPKIISECIQDLESRGMSSQGIYRVSGHSSEILELKDKYNEGTFPTLDSEV